MSWCQRVYSRASLPLLDNGHPIQHLVISCKRLLVELVESRAAAQPQAVFAKVPRDNAYANGYRVVTNSALVTAVDYVAALITSTFGPSVDFQRIAYLGLHDLRYTIVLLAGIKSGYTMFLPSPRNSGEAHAALLTSLDCSKLITTYPAPAGLAVVESITSEKLVLPTLNELLDLDQGHVRTVTYHKSFEDARTDPIFILHTSGSTGIPKPLTYTNEYVARVYNTQSLVPPAGFESVSKKLQNGSCLVMLPPFHIAGLAFTLLFPAFYDSIPVYPTVGIPPGLDVFLGALDATPTDSPIKCAFVSPVVVDEIGKDPRVLETVVSSKLKHLFFTGGSVPHESGTVVAQEMDLNQILGSSECAAFPLLLQEGLDRAQSWHYVHVHPDANVEFRHRYDEYYEMVQVRGKESFQPVFCHFSTLRAYETKDLFTKHPTLPDTYSHAGRLDDIIVFLNGEKTNPVTFEDRVARHPEVRAALVVGHQRQEAALLVEPTDGQLLFEADRQALIERIWPTVDSCNMICPRHAKVSKTKILVVPAHMAFLRAGKGTVQRRSTIAMFESAIDLLYSEDDEVEAALDVGTLAGPLSIGEVMAVVGRLVNSKCNTSLSTSDFFSEGMMDSLQAIWLRRELKRAFPSVSTTMEMIYSNPTIHSLASSIVQASSGNAGETQRADELGQTLQRYFCAIDAMHGNKVTLPDVASCDLPEESVGHSLPTAGYTIQSGQPMSPSPKTKGAVLLTGSTGALGSHLLNTLMNCEGLHVYCLNRSLDSHRLQIGRNKSAGLPVVFPAGRVQFLTGNPALPKFGLDDQVFEDLLGSVTNVIHNAWPVDFNKSLRSFAGSLDGVLGLIDFAHRSQGKVALQFVSSIAAVAGSPGRHFIPEEAATQTQAPVSVGYGQSKYLAERMLTHASQVLGIRTVVARVGQISGDASRKCGWNRREWFPSMVASSLYLRALPNTLGCGENGKEVAWTPVDAAAKILHELFMTSLDPGGNVIFHMVHPRPTAWAELLPTILAALNKAVTRRGGFQVEVVDYHEWFNRLQSSFDADVADDEALSANPAVKLLPFFESLLSNEDLTGNFDVSRSTASSKTMQSLGSIRADCLEAWINGWIHGTGDGAKVSDGELQ
jgi:thioester reductase-like protein/acyl-CoA synthetase (AMP-forming)/AMP-acid ligase II